MGLKETTKHLKELLTHITHDLDKADNGNKAASQRVRTGTVKLEKTAKLYRKESIKSERQTKPAKKTAKKAAPKKAAPKKAAPHKAAPHKAHKAVARPRALSFKKPSARLPAKRA